MNLDEIATLIDIVRDLNAIALEEVESEEIMMPFEIRTDGEHAIVVLYDYSVWDSDDHHIDDAEEIIKAQYNKTLTQMGTKPFDI